MAAIPPSGEPVPALGLGTWGMGERTDRRAEEIASLRLGLDLGMTLIDTAEMYGDGATEALLGDAIADRRREFFLVSKVLPSHATKRGTVAACEASLKRLKTDVIDLYLLHWRGSVPLAETIDGFLALMRAGKIRHWGVSNLDLDDMEELLPLARDRKSAVSTNQVLYNLTRRGIEWDLVPYCAEQGIPIMAYSPVEQGRLLTDKRLKSIAGTHQRTPAQIALAWVLRQPGIIAIPKAGRREHVRDNRGALDVSLTAEDLRELDTAFRPPSKKRPLEVL